MATETKGVSIVPLNSRNYATWKLQSRMTLMKEGLWTIVNGTEVPPADGADEAVVTRYIARKDRALATIVLSIDPSLLYLLGEPKDAVEVWKQLESQFQKRNWSNKLILRRKLHSLQLKDGASMQDHIREMVELFNDLAVVGAPIDNEDQVVYLLASLPESYDTLVTALEANEKVPSMETVIDRLTYEERKAIERDSSSHSSGSKEKALSHHGKKARSSIRCHYCKKLGHMIKDCHERMKNEKEKKPVQPQRSKGKGANVSLLATYALATSRLNQRNSWIVDSGATCHICCNKKLFNELELESSVEITLGDNTTIKSSGSGTVKLQLDGSHRNGILHNVLFVPQLTFNLLSVTQTTKYGNRAVFYDTGCHIINNDVDEVIATATKHGSLYYLDCSSSNESVNSTIHTADVNKWHQRYGHLNVQSLKKLANEELVDGLNIDNIASDADICESCIKGKLHRTPFPSTGGKRADAPLELVHTDVCGKINTRSLGGAEYFLTFIDDHTRYIWVYMLKYKSEVFKRFVEWKSMVERSTGRKLKVIRSDNGGEYTSNEFKAYLTSEGIKHELTIPRTPEQNGVAERANRTLIESVRSMLIGTNLPQSFWAEALSTAVYLKNRSPTKIIKHKTPHEALFSSKPKVNHLRVFGCVCYAHIAKEERSKLDSKATKCVLLGYGSVIKGYRVYDIEDKRVFYSRDVVFNEERFGFEKESKTSDIPIMFELYDDTIDELDVDDEDVTQDDDPPGPNPEEPPPSPVQPVLRRSDRIRRKPDYYGVYLNTTQANEPSTVNEALSSSEADKWKEAMDIEMESLKANDVYDLVELPKDKKVIGSKWIFKRKINADGSVERYKARLVAQGFSQTHGRDYDETFCPVIRFESIRSVIAVAVQNDLILHQMDVTSAFLNGTLEEEVFMQQPEGYKSEGETQLVCKLKRSLYGLKQAPRCWNTALDTRLKDMGFNQSSSDPCLYISTGKELVIVAVYVDDILLASKSQEKMKEIKGMLSTSFDIKDMGELHYFLGVKVLKNSTDNSIWIGQPNYTAEIIEKFGLKDAKSIATPVNPAVKLVKAQEGDELADMNIYQSAVGSLQYLSTMSRPDITYAVSNVAKFLSKPTKVHWTAVKRIIRYLKGTLNYGLVYRKRSLTGVIGYSDSDFAGDQDDRKSTSGYIFQIGNTAISWKSKKQTSTALSTAEAEYIALSQAAQEAIWLRQLSSDLKCLIVNPTVLYEDNQAAICIAKNPQSHGRSKHIEIKYHFIREEISKKNIEVKYCNTEDMVADMLTKGLGKEKFVKLRALAGMALSFDSEKEC